MTGEGKVVHRQQYLQEFEPVTNVDVVDTVPFLSTCNP